jgi:hypothetical protein
LVVVAGHPGLLRWRAAGRPAVGPTAHPWTAGHWRRGRAGLPARVCHRRAGVGPAAAGQPDRLVVWRLGPGLGADHPVRALAEHAARRPPATGAGRSGRRGGPRDQLGGGHRAGPHPAVPAAARRAAAVTPLAAGGCRHGGRGGPVGARPRPGPGTADRRPRPDRQPLRAPGGGRQAGQGGRHPRAGAVRGQPASRLGRPRAAVPGLPGDRAPAAALGRRRGRRGRDLAGPQARRGAAPGVPDPAGGAGRAGVGGRGGAALPAVGSGPPG